MGTFAVQSFQNYTFSGGNYTPNTDPGSSGNGVSIQLQETGVDGAINSIFEVGEDIFVVGPNVTIDFLGIVSFGGVTFFAFQTAAGGGTNVALVSNLPNPTYPTGAISFTSADIISGNQPFCFAPGTLIATPTGECAVEALGIGDMVLTAEGRGVAVKWIGRQGIVPMFVGLRAEPVRIRAGALGDGLPHSDLTVTADHGMIVDGLVINAGALVNGGSIDWMPMAELPDRVTYYHVETEAHDVILANGAPAETFIDYAGRQAFDNYQEYLDLYGCEHLVPEMGRPRISAQRLVPEAVRARLGIPAEPVFNWDDLEPFETKAQPNQPGHRRRRKAA